ncbi:hypothetical protein BSKO_05670 [Bryopsis sp. KO-2023]|nr:hypothetical protein BSKO_05670 [Bryopsis sp. KO-2023]
MSVPWSSGVLGCCDDCGVCCKGICCPCCLYADNAKWSKGTGRCKSGCVYLCCTGIGCMWLYSVGIRTTIRSKYNLKPQPCGDCCTHFCCHYCALCQEARELKFRRRQVNYAPAPAPAPAYHPPTLPNSGPMV